MSLFLRWDCLKKRHCLSAMSLFEGGTAHKKKTLPIGDVSFSRVPGGTRTHDIQNHNLTL